MFNILKEVWGDCLLIALGLFYLGHFIAFLFIGTIEVGESNKVILWLEIALCVGVATLGVERLIKDIKRFK